LIFAATRCGEIRFGSGGESARAEWKLNGVMTSLDQPHEIVTAPFGEPVTASIE
jgi:hypothetical protein